MPNQLIGILMANPVMKEMKTNTSIKEKVEIFNRTILNVLSNFIPHETIVCNDKDPPWFNNRI